MGEVVNLNQYRKRRERSRSQNRAAGSRAKGGGGEQETRVDHEPERVGGDFEDKQPDKPSPPKDTPSAS